MLGEFFTIPPMVTMIEADGKIHEAADGRGPACPQWTYPVRLEYRGVTLVAYSYQQLLELTRKLPKK